MSFTLDQFTQISSRSGQVSLANNALTATGNATVTANDKLSKAEQAANQSLRQAFIRAVGANYDGFATLEAATRIGGVSGAGLAVQDLKAAIDALGANHKLIAPSGLKAAIDQLASDNPQLAERVLAKAKGLAMPVSTYLLTKMVAREAQAQNLPPVAMPASSQPFMAVAKSGPKAFVAGNPCDLHKQSWDKVLSALATGTVATAKPAEFFSGVDVVSSTTSHREWHLNFAMLTGLADDANLPPDTRAILNERAVSYLYKYSSAKNPVQSGFQVTPLCTSGVYHRTGNPLSSQLSGVLDKHPQGLGGSTPSATLLPVSSSTALDAIRLRYGAGGGTGHWLTVTAEGVANVASQVAARILEDTGSVVIDINAMAVATPPSPASAQAQPPTLAQRLASARASLLTQIDTQVRAYADSRPVSSTGPTADELREQIMAKVALVANVDVAGQPAVLLAALDENDELDRTVSASADLPELFSARGFNAGPAQVFETWAATTSPAAILKAIAKADPVTLSYEDSLPDATGRLAAFSNFTELLGHPAVQKFDKLVKDSAPGKPTLGDPLVSGKPYVHRLGSVMLAQIQGLQAKLGNATFAGPNQAVMSYLCNRMAAIMDDAVGKAANQQAFIDQMQLLAEEITTAVSVLAPFKASDLDLGLPKAGGIAPRYAFANGGMNAFSMVLSGVEALKGSADIHVMTQKRGYYEESLYAVGAIDQYEKSTLDGRKAELEVHRVSQAQAKPIDLFVAEFSHNISVDESRYAPENLIKQIELLLNADPPVVASKFTVAIDATLNKADDAAIQTLVKRFSKEIADGKLNLVLFRSGQKFDMAGMDNFNAGLVATYNKADVFAAYNTGTGESQFTPPASTLQGMLLLENAAAAQIDGYRDAIRNANRSLIGALNPARLPRDLIGGGDIARMNESHHLVQVNPSSDPGAVFLDIQSPFAAKAPTVENSECLSAMMGRFIKLARSEGLPCGDRPSFGFPHLNISPLLGAGVEHPKLRLTLGLETQEGLTKVRNILVAMDKAGQLAALAGVPVNKLTSIIESNDSLFTLLLKLANRGSDFLTIGSGGKLLLADHLSPEDLRGLDAELGPLGIDLWALAPTSCDAIAQGWLEHAQALMTKKSYPAAETALTQLQASLQKAGNHIKQTTKLAVADLLSNAKAAQIPPVVVKPAVDTGAKAAVVSQDSDSDEEVNFGSLLDDP